MKKIFLNLSLLFLVLGFSQNLQAQAPGCTPAEMAACKKICKTTDISKCTVAQLKECKKATTSTASTSLFNFNTLFASNKVTSKEGKTACCSPCPPSCCTSSASVKLTKNSAPSCTSAKVKVAQEGKTASMPIAQNE